MPLLEPGFRPKQLGSLGVFSLHTVRLNLLHTWPQGFPSPQVAGAGQTGSV